MIFEPLRIQQRTGESLRAREVPGFRLTKFHVVAAQTEASRCSSERLQWTAKIINSMSLIWGWQCLPLSERWRCGRAGNSHRLGNWGMKGSEAPQVIFAFTLFLLRVFQVCFVPWGLCCRSLLCRGPGSRGSPRCWCIH